VSDWAPTLPIETERLTLRVHRMADLDDLVVFHGDPEATRYIPWPVRTREQTEEALLPKLTRDIARAAGDWLVLAIEERATGTVIGEVLLKREDEGLAEVGYVIRTDRQGQGLASEAVRAMLELGFVDYDRRAIDAMIVRGNDASVRLVERFRFVRNDSLDGVAGDEVVEGYRLEAATWRAHETATST
jgi:RimJ/RimL family protein N-acetyltransferase